MTRAEGRLRILRPGHNVWRIEQAVRAAVLIDGAAYFRAVREALLKAERSVFIVGWDIHSQTPLVGESGEADDGYPPLLADFLTALVQKRPKLVIHLLLWDFAVLYAAEREFFPRWALNWKTPAQVRFRLDRAVPLGSSQHQKLIVVDDCVAFSGGLDVTIRRWDTSEHRFEHPFRLDPAGKPYRSFHDVQAVVEGPAAAALGKIARARWACAKGKEPPMVGSGDCWPDSVTPDFTHVEIGIARTQPPYEVQEEVCEVQQLFFDSIEAAERTIYIENQFLTCGKIAERLAAQMKKNRRLETLIISPQHAESWIEARTTRNGRIRFTRCLAEAGVGDRLRILYPEVAKGEERIDTMIHSKIMVIDDTFLRVGSANLNNRSMGTDTECDLAVEAASTKERERIAGIRARLLADHCGVEPEEIAAALEQGSLIAAAERLSGRGHRLRPIDDGEPDEAEFSAYIEQIADPERPIGIDAFAGTFEVRLQRRQLSTVLKVGFVAALLGLLALAWQFTSLAEYTDVDFVRDSLAGMTATWWAPLIVVGVFILAGLIVFPLTILIAATAAAFGPWLGMAYAATGALLSAMVVYAIGAKLGQRTLREFLGPRLDRVRQRIARNGVIAVAAIRLVPVAPFTVVNLVAGASQIKPFDYLVGTALGLTPGLIVLSVLGHQVVRVLSEPTPVDVAILIVAVTAWIGISIAVQVLVSKFWSART